MPPPGPRTPPVLQTLEWVARPDVLLRRAARAHGEPCTLRTSWSDAPLVLVWSPEAIRAVYGAPAGVLGAGAASSSLLVPFTGPRSVLVSDGEAHLRRRRELLAPLRGSRLQALRPVVTDLASREVASWSGAIRALPRMRALTLDVILHAAFGRPDPELRAVVRRALDLTSSTPRLLAMVLVRRDLGPRSPYGAFLRAVEELDRVVYARIAQRRRAPGDALADALCAATDDDGEVRDQLVTVLAAGHETTATALAWALERLARRPDAMARIRAGDEPYLEAVVQEVLRVRPVLSVTPRRVLASFAVAGHVLEPGVDVAPCIWLAHRDPRTFPDPDAFRPERWLGAPAARPGFIPWGGGTRRCAGAGLAAMELREVLRVVARRVELAPAGRGADEAARRRSVTLAPARGGAIRVSPIR